MRITDRYELSHVEISGKRVSRQYDDVWGNRTSIRGSPEKLFGTIVAYTKICGTLTNMLWPRENPRRSVDLGKIRMRAPVGRINGLASLRNPGWRAGRLMTQRRHSLPPRDRHCQKCHRRLYALVSAANNTMSAVRAETASC